MSLAALAAPAAHAALVEALARWVPGQRWFAGKARSVARFDVADTALLDDVVLLVLADVTYADGGTERYQVPLAVGDRRAEPHTRVTQLGHDVVVDATTVPDASLAVARLAVQPNEARTANGARVIGAPTGDEDVTLASPRRMGVEQSNTSVVFDERHILKVFRRLEHGVNPDVEVTRALTEAKFPHTPAQRGVLLLEDGGDEAALAVLTDFVAGGREGWALASAEVARLGRDGPTVLRDASADLGRAVGALHVTLHDAFGSRPGTSADAAGWAAAFRAQAGAVLATAGERAPDECAGVLERAGELSARFDAVAAVRTPGPLGRVHGDLHLGQVLLDADSTWQILDFEGEPAKSLPQRQAFGSPLRDVAGMLRSFDYAAAALDPLDPPAAATAWRDACRSRFLDAYLAAAEPALPPPDARAPLLLAFELDKAVYELGYELANRPPWVPIPVGGIVRLLGG